MTDQGQGPEAPPKGFDVNFVREFMSQRQGKWTVSYGGLLHLAHERGLVGIETNVLQFPTADNGMTCVVRADVRLERDGKVHTFADIGDANTSNVSKMVAQHIIRMASTRAKARALRDAVNIGVTALEELAESDEGETARPQPQPQRPPAPASGGTRPASNGHPPSVTPNGHVAPDGYFELEIDGHAWRVPASFRNFRSVKLDAYAAWVRKARDGRTFVDLQNAWKAVEPAATREGEAMLEQIRSIFSWKKRQLEKAQREAANGHHATA